MKALTHKRYSELIEVFVKELAVVAEKSHRTDRTQTGNIVIGIIAGVAHAEEYRNILKPEMDSTAQNFIESEMSR